MCSPKDLTKSTLFILLSFFISCLCDVTLSVYPHRAGMKNMPGHGGNRTCWYITPTQKISLFISLEIDCFHSQ
jgi:hypothetical protein